MKKAILFLTVFSLTLSIGGYYCIAATTNVTPSEYTVTVHKVELYNSSTAKWVTVGSGDLTFDIASINAGAVVGSYVSGTAIPEGVYTKERTTVSMTFYLTASAVIGATTYYTSTGTTTLSDPAGLVAISADTTGPAVEGTAVLSAAALADSGLTAEGDYFYHEGNLPSPITVKKGFSKRLRVEFDVTNAVQFNDAIGSGVFYPLPPTVTFEVITN